MKLDTSSLAHTKWECKYHIVFAPKYRGTEIFGEIKADMGKNTATAISAKGRGDD